jgi:hypothetical protein
MRNNPSASDDWLNNLPASHADYLSYNKITLGRHPSAFLVYANEIKFIKQVPKNIQHIEYSFLFWLQQLQLIPESSLHMPEELKLAKPDLLTARPDLLVTSKLEGDEFSKANLLTHLPSINKALIYIHKLVHLDTLPKGMFLPKKHDLPIDIDEVAPRFRKQFVDAKINIDKQGAILALVHGDLSVGNILFNNNNSVSNQNAINIGLIDWEYVAIRDCRWDLATLAIEFDLSTGEFEALCRNYVEQRELSEIKESDFIQVAKSWLVVYAITCLSWAKEHAQDTNRYIQFLRQLKN